MGILLSYVAITLSYTVFLKRIALVDVFVIALLFTLRLVFGIIIADVRLSPWLLVFSMFCSCRYRLPSGIPSCDSSVTRAMSPR